MSKFWPQPFLVCNLRQFIVCECCLCALINPCQTVFSSYPHALSYFPAEYFRANSWLAGSQQSTPLFLSLSLSLLQHVSLSVCSCSSSDFNSSLLCSLGLLSSLAYGLQYAPSPLASPYPSNSPLLSPRTWVSTESVWVSALSLERLPLRPRDFIPLLPQQRRRNLKQVMSQGSHPAHL